MLVDDMILGSDTTPLYDRLSTHLELMSYNHEQDLTIETDHEEIRES